jgi:hypothetical protein
LGVAPDWMAVMRAGLESIIYMRGWSVGFRVVSPQ